MLYGMTAMLNRIVLLAASSALVLSAALLLARLVDRDAPPASLDELRAAPRVEDEFIRDPARVSLPKASHGSFPVPTSRTANPSRRDGEFSGRFYAAFETSWFQPSDKSELWFLMGPDSGSLWALWESDRKIPYGPDHPDFHPSDPRPMEDWYWPYVCVETTVRGSWKSSPAESIYAGTLSVDEVVEATLVDIPLDDCIPASRYPKLSGWIVSRRITIACRLTVF
jgi:hypothetical protein